MRYDPDGGGTRCRPYPMRILIDYRPALTERTGAGEYGHEVVRSMLAVTPRIDEFTLFSSSWKDRISDAARSALAGARFVDRRIPVRVLNLAWHRLGWPPVELLAGGRYDVAHSLHPLLLPARRAAQVVTIHDLDFLEHPERTRAEVHRDYPALAARHARLADHIVVPSHYTAGLVSHRFDIAPDHISVCPPGAPDWRTAATPKPDTNREPYILFLGTLEPRKNVGVLLDAYGRLLASRSNVPRLVIAGRSTRDAAPWLTRFSQPPFAETVEYLGYVPDADRRSLFEGARVFVYPSLEEGFGLPVLEALSLGVPVVASSRGALPEVVGDAGMLVEPEPEAIASAIGHILNDASTAARLAELGRARATRFSWPASAASLRRAYEAAVRSRVDRLH